MRDPQSRWRRALCAGIVACVLAALFVWRQPWRADAGGGALPVAGDVNSDGRLDLTDPVVLLNHLFLGGPAPVPCPVPMVQPVSTAFIVRHAERESGGCEALLTAAGQARAQSLARILGPTGVSHLISSECIRTRLTLEPLATATGLAIEPIAVEADVAARVRGLPPGSISAIAHHSFTLHDILRALGVEGGESINFSAEYDNLLVVLFPASGRPQLVRMKY